MSMFVVVAALLVAAALLFIVPPLWQRRERKSVQRTLSNLEIYKDQLRELEADLAVGTISQEQFEHGKIELERRMLEDVTPEPAPAAAQDSGAGRSAAVAVALVVPLLAILIYLIQGNPQGLNPESVTVETAGSGPGHSVTMDQIEAMVVSLAERLQNSPNDPEGWRMLGKSLAAMGRHEESADAFAVGVRLVPDDPDLLTDYADALAMTSENQTLEGQPRELIEKALAVDPRHQKGLWLAGTAAYDRGDYREAAAYWERLMPLVEPGSEDERQVQNIVAEARGLAARSGSLPAQAPPASAAAVEARISGVVSVSPAVAAQVTSGDTLFVFARAVQGPRMPVAIVRAQAADLPFTFTLSDAAAVMPMAKLSDFSEVVVGARLSKSGNATPESGDLEGFTNAVSVVGTEVQVVIDTVVP